MNNKLESNNYGHLVHPRDWSIEELFHYCDENHINVNKLKSHQEVVEAVLKYEIDLE